MPRDFISSLKLHAQTAWNYMPKPDWDRHFGQTQHPWGDLPKEELPQPWSCNWLRWGLNGDPSSIIPGLGDRFRLAMLKPLIFRNTRTNNRTTVFVGVEERLKSPRFYFYDAPAEDLFRFEQVPEGTASTGAAEFVATANWNRMTHLGSIVDPGAILKHRNIPGSPLLLHGLHEVSAIRA